MSRFKNTWSLMKSSLRVLRQEKKLLIFPVLSGLASLIVIISFITPVWLTGQFEALHTYFEESTAGALSVVFLFYFVNYFFILFFNSAAVVSAIHVMKGGNPSLTKAMKLVWSRKSALFGWTFIAASVGLLLNTLENQSDKFGKILTGFLGLSWTVISFLVLPVLIIEKKGPIESLKESVKMLKDSWGEQLIGHFSFGLVFFFLALGVSIVVFPLFLLGPVFVVIGIVLAFISLIMLSILQWILQSIFMGAVYIFVREKSLPSGFSEYQIDCAMK